MNMRKTTSSGLLLIALFAVLATVSEPCHAMGVAHGRTKIDFRLTIGDSTSSRLFAKLDVSGAVTSNGNSFFDQSSGNGHGKSGSHGSKNFALAGFDVTVMIGSASFTGTADAKGKVATPFTAKLTANGRILQIMANGLNLEQLFPIDPTDGDHQVTVPLIVTATKSTTSATTGVTTTVNATLSSQNVTFFYSVKNGKAHGKNF
jgi:hypothetical protein